MKKTTGLLISIFIVCLIFIRSANADWINFSSAENAPNIAEIHINDDHVKVVLEIFVDDLVTFHHLVPDDFFEGKDIKRPPLAERLRQFSNEGLQIITDKGEKLQAQLKLAEPRMRREQFSPLVGTINPYTGQPFPGPPEDKRVLYAELIYPFKVKPKTLTIVPPLDDTGIPAATIGFITYHKGVLVIDFRYLSEASRLHLDWNDPWYSSYEKKALMRWQWTGVMTFLYIEPYEVRHETLVRLKDLASWMDLGLRGEEYIEVDEFEPLKQRVAQFFLDREKVLIDGKASKPILDKTSFVTYSRMRSTFIDKPQKRMPLNTAMLGIIITYITDGIPQEVTAEWDLFSDKIPVVKANMIDPAGPLPYDLTPDDNVLKWTNFLRKYTIPTVDKVSVKDTMKGVSIPIASVMCLVLIGLVVWHIRKRKREAKPVLLHVGLIVLLIAGSVFLYPYLNVSIGKSSVLGPKLTKDEAVVILHSLLKNVYRAFDFREEDDVYTKLEVSVSGDLLEDVYLQSRKSLVVEQAGGAQAIVRDIEVMDVSVEELGNRPLAFALTSKWAALGTVGHWGHIHTRQNQYDAIITIESVEGAWKITGLELLEEKRIDPYKKL